MHAALLPRKFTLQPNRTDVMPLIELIVTGLIVLAALLYLVRRWRRHFAKRGTGCGCGTTGCKVGEAARDKRTSDAVARHSR